MQLLSLMLLVSCQSKINNVNTEGEGSTTGMQNTQENGVRKDTTIIFLSRVSEKDHHSGDGTRNMIINEAYCKQISDPEKAALGYVATFIGNDCWWDGEANEDRSNLQCKILTALDLGYQCSEKHLGYLRNWFAGDTAVLAQLVNANCPTIPYTATIQTTFDEIKLTRKANKIEIWYKANGINMRSGQGWSWTETDFFQVNENTLKLTHADKSEMQPEILETGEQG